MAWSRRRSVSILGAEGFLHSLRRILQTHICKLSSSELSVFVRTRSDHGPQQGSSKVDNGLVEMRYPP